MSKWSAKPDTEATWKKSAATEASGQYVHKLYLYLYIEKIKFNKKDACYFIATVLYPLKISFISDLHFLKISTCGTKHSGMTLKVNPCFFSNPTN
jgi:hypothetical protein